MQPLESHSPRLDPAPSRWAYRIERLWLTPMFRLAMRIGVPMALTFTAATVYLADQERRDALFLGVADLKASIQERPEFMVQLMAIDGASDEVAEDLREVIPLDFPISSFDLDLEQMRQTALELDAVAEARVRIRPGGTLQIEVTERVPALVWKSREGLELLDAEGRRVAPLEARGNRTDLPMIAGEGADAHAAEALALIRAAAPIKDRLVGLVRMGERRWDVVLDRDQRILLPENAPVRALERVIALSQAQDMLARDLAAIDMRNPKRPTIRLNEAAVAAYLDIKSFTGDQAE